MKIRKTKMDDLDAVMKIYEIARKFMAENNNPNQWGKKNWPPESLIIDDIKSEKSYVCVNDDDRVIAVFFYDYGYRIEPTYDKIVNGKWIGSDEYGVIHRIASDMSEKGIGAFCINYAFDKSKHLRIDTHEDNIVMQNLLSKLKFKKCGIIYVYDGKDERVAFEKLSE